MTAHQTPSLLAAVALSGLASCRHVSPPDIGTSSFTIVPPAPTVNTPSSGARVVEAPSSGAQYAEATLVSRPVLPTYPPRALAARAGAARIAVHLTIDAKGSVSAVSPSMRAATLAPQAFADEFFRAVETAVLQWKFHPARIEYVETVNESGITFERLTRTEPVESELDLSFDFTATGGVGPGR